MFVSPPDAVQRQPSPGKRDEEEMRFTGIRRPDNPIPSRAFHTLQKMTQGADGNANQQGKKKTELLVILDSDDSLNYTI